MAAKTDSIELRQVRNDLDFYKRLASAQKRTIANQKAVLNKMPQRSFVCIQLTDKEDSVRKNNELTRLYHDLSERYYGGNVRYIEEGIERFAKK